MRILFLAAALAIGVAAPPVWSQTAVLSGSVLRDSAGHPIQGAQISIPKLGKLATSNAFGDFRISDLPTGSYVVIVRAIGLAPIQDSVALADGRETERDFILAQRVQLLDPVVAVSSPPNLAEWWKPDFEWRRRSGIGHFFGEEDLRKRDNDNLPSILHQTPGVDLVPYGSGYILRASRGSTSIGGGTQLIRNGPLDKPPTGCWVSVYLDGVAIYRAPGHGQIPPDLTRFEGKDLAAVEFYAGPAQTPAQYGGNKGACGSLVLWTRVK